MKQRDSRGRFVKRGGSSNTAIVVRRSSAIARRGGGAVTVVSAPSGGGGSGRRGGRRRGASRRKLPVKEMVVAGAAGYALGRWLQGEAGKKWLAESEHNKKHGIGLIAAAAGVAICHFAPKYDYIGLPVAAFGAMTYGLRMSSEAKPEKQPLGIAGPDLAALASLDVSGPDVLDEADGLEGDGY